MSFVSAILSTKSDVTDVNELLDIALLFNNLTVVCLYTVLGSVKRIPPQQV